MKIRSWRWVALVAAAISVLGASVGLAQKAPSPQPQAERDPAPGQVTPLAVDTFDGRVEPVDGTDDRTHLAYELRLTNITAADLTIERVRVLDPSRGGQVVDELSGDEIASRTVVFGGAPDKQFGPGVSGFLFMDVTYLPARGCRSVWCTASTCRPASLQAWPTASGPARRACPVKNRRRSDLRSSGRGG